MNMQTINSETVIAALRDSPEVRAHLDLAAQRKIEMRKRAVADLENLDKQAGETYLRNVAATEKAEKACAKMQAALIAAKQELNSIIGKRMSDSLLMDRKRVELLAVLTQSASPQIDAFVVRMRDELERAMKTAPEIDVRESKNLVTGRREVTSKPTRVVQPKERVVAIRTAIDIAEGMKLEADQHDVAVRLAEIEAAFPVIGAPK